MVTGGVSWPPNGPGVFQQVWSAQRERACPPLAEAGVEMLDRLSRRSSLRGVQVQPGADAQVAGLITQRQSPAIYHEMHQVSQQRRPALLKKRSVSLDPMRGRAPVSSTSLGKIAVAIAGTTGTSGLGVTGFAVLRMTSAHAVPGGAWAALATLGAATALVSSLGLILEYRLRKLDLEERGKEAQSAADLQKARLEMHRVVMEKAAGEPGSAQSYRELIIADALHLSVEQNRVRLADRTHAHLYGPQAKPGQPGGPP